MKFSKTFLPWAMAFLMLLSASCMNVTEEFFFRKDGSGSARIIVDISQMMELMKAFSGMSEENSSGEDPMAEMNEAFDDTETIDKLKGMGGISNVQSLNDKENGVIGYSFDFENIESLNRAIAENAADGGLTAAMGLGGDSEVPTDQFAWNGKKFSRTHPIDEAMANKEEDEETEESMEMMKMMFADAKYTVKYTFEGGVKKAKGENATVSSDKKSISVETPMLSLLDGSAKLSTSAKTK